MLERSDDAQRLCN